MYVLLLVVGSRSASENLCECAVNGFELLCQRRDDRLVEHLREGQGGDARAGAGKRGLKEEDGDDVALARTSAQTSKPPSMAKFRSAPQASFWIWLSGSASRPMSKATTLLDCRRRRVELSDAPRMCEMAEVDQSRSEASVDLSCGLSHGKRRQTRCWPRSRPASSSSSSSGSIASPSVRRGEAAVPCPSTRSLLLLPCLTAQLTF